MGKFESALGSSRFGNVPVKEFDITDESDMKAAGVDLNALNKALGSGINPFFEESSDSHQIENDIKNARDLRKNPAKERLSEGAKKRIELLINMSRLTREVDIEGNVYTFQSLLSKESREIWNDSISFDGKVDFPFELRRQTLARSLTKIAGISIEDFIGSRNLEDKLLFLDELPDSLLLRLYQEYSVLVKETEQKFSIKTDKDAKEVVDDLKK